MFKRLWMWLKGWFTPGTRYDVYQVQRRFVYTYFDGKGMMQVDPMRLYRRLIEVGPELVQSIIKFQTTQDQQEVLTAHETLATKVRDIFQLTSYEAGGLTHLETLNLFNHFLGFINQIEQDGQG